MAEPPDSHCTVDIVVLVAGSRRKRLTQQRTRPGVFIPRRKHTEHTRPGNSPRNRPVVQGISPHGWSLSRLTRAALRISDCKVGSLLRPLGSRTSSMGGDTTHLPCRLVRYCRTVWRHGRSARCPRTNTACSGLGYAHCATGGSVRQLNTVSFQYGCSITPAYPAGPLAAGQPPRLLRCEATQ
jgi:hypothetical protein